MRAGVSINPATPADSLAEIVPYIDLVLIMSVNPGFGGQHYIPTVTDKIRRVRKMLDVGGYDAIHLEVDGGVSSENAAEVTAAGADVLVAGSAIYNERGSVGDNLAALRAAADAGNR